MLTVDREAGNERWGRCEIWPGASHRDEGGVTWMGVLGVCYSRTQACLLWEVAKLGCSTGGQAQPARTNETDLLTVNVYRVT